MAPIAVLSPRAAPSPTGAKPGTATQSGGNNSTKSKGSFSKGIHFDCGQEVMFPSLAHQPRTPCIRQPVCPSAGAAGPDAADAHSSEPGSECGPCTGC